MTKKYESDFNSAGLILQKSKRKPLDGWKYISYEERQRDVGLLNLEKRRLQGDSVLWTLNTQRKIERKKRTKFLVWSVAIGQGVVVLN